MPNETTPSPAKRKPVCTISHECIHVRIFRELRTSKKGRLWTSYSVRLQRRYFDPKAREGLSTNTLFDSDLLDASQALVKAYHWIEIDRRESAKTVAEEESEAVGES